MDRGKETEGMNGDFDPYAEWLKIPPGRRPPSYYDLVGVPEDETDRQRIDDVAMERMDRVRSRALGQQGDHVTRVLNELSQALDCLISPARREAYDRKRLHEVVDGWLATGRKPADFYELLDTHRFTPDRVHLLRAIRSARRCLEDRSGDGGPGAEHGAELLAELDNAQTALSGPSAFQQYHRPILARLYADYVREHGRDETLWDLTQLRAWLQRAGRVHPHRAEAIVCGMCDAKIEAWDQLLVELFPVGGGVDALAAEPSLAGLPDEAASQSGASGAPGASARPRPKPPKLPPVYAEREDADEPAAGWAGDLFKHVIRCFARPVPILIAVGCVVTAALIVIAVSLGGREPAPAEAAAALSPEARRQLREAQFAEATELLLQKPPDYQAVLARLQATCSEFPELEGLDREYALSAWCCANLGQWPETWDCYREARRRLGPAGPETPDPSGDVRSWLADVRQIVYLSTAPETRALWRDMGQLERELGGTLERPAGLGALVELPAESRQWIGPLTRLVVYRGEVHLLVTLAQPESGIQSVEAFTDRADFAGQIRDYRSAVECGVADMVSVKGTWLRDTKSPAGHETMPGYRLQPEAILVHLERLERVGDPQSRAEVGRQLRTAFRRWRETAKLAQYLQAPPEAGTGQTIQFDCLVASFTDVAETESGGLAQTLYVTSHPQSPRSVEVAVSSGTDIGVASFSKGDLVLIDARVVRSDHDELVLEAVAIHGPPKSSPEQVPVKQTAAVEPSTQKRGEAESEGETRGRAAVEDPSMPRPPPADLGGQSEPEPPAEAEPGQPPQGQVLRVQAHHGAICRVAWCPNDNYLATAGDQTAKVWDPWTGRTVHTYGGQSPVTDLAWCPRNLDSRKVLIAVGSRDQDVKVFDAAAETAQPRSYNAGSPVSCLTWSPDGKRLAAGLESGELMVCNAVDGGTVQKRPSSFRAISSIACHPSATRLLALADEEGLVWVWDLARWLPAFGRVDLNLDSFRTMIAGNPELRQLVTSGSVRLVSRRAGPCYELAWSPDGDRLAAVENGIELWEFDPVEGLKWSRSLTEWEGPPAGGRRQNPPVSAPFVTAAWHPGGRCLAAGASDGRVVVFDVFTGGSLSEFAAPAGVGSVAWSRRGRHLAAGSEDGTLTVWAFER